MNEREKEGNRRRESVEEEEISSDTPLQETEGVIK